MGHLADEGSTARLNGLDLSGTEGDAAEASGELRDIEESAIRSGDRAEAGTGGTTNAVLGSEGLLEGAVLLGVVTVAAEGVVGGRGRAVAVVGEVLGEAAGRGGRVRLGGVIDVGRDGARTEEPDEGSALGVHSSLAKSSSSGEHGDGL